MFIVISLLKNSTELSYTVQCEVLSHQAVKDEVFLCLVLFVSHCLTPWIFPPLYRSRLHLLYVQRRLLTDDFFQFGNELRGCVSHSLPQFIELQN